MASQPEKPEKPEKKKNPFKRGFEKIFGSEPKDSQKGSSSSASVVQASTPTAAQRAPKVTERTKKQPNTEPAGTANTALPPPPATENPINDSPPHPNTNPNPDNNPPVPKLQGNARPAPIEGGPVNTTATPALVRTNDGNQPQDAPAAGEPGTAAKENPGNNTTKTITDPPPNPFYFPRAPLWNMAIEIFRNPPPDEEGEIVVEEAPNVEGLEEEPEADDKKEDKKKTKEKEEKEKPKNKKADKQKLTRQEKIRLVTNLLSQGFGERDEYGNPILMGFAPNEAGMSSEARARIKRWLPAIDNVKGIATAIAGE